MRILKFGVSVCVLVWVVATLAEETGARQNKTVRAVYVYDVGNAVEVAANGLEQQGYEVFQIANSGYYPTGERRVAIWVKGYGLTAPVLDYTPPAPVELPSIYGTNCPNYPNAPFPGAKCYKNGGWNY